MTTTHHLGSGFHNGGRGAVKLVHLEFESYLEGGEREREKEREGKRERERERERERRERDSRVAGWPPS